LYVAVGVVGIATVCGCRQGTRKPQSPVGPSSRISRICLCRGRALLDPISASSLIPVILLAPSFEGNEVCELRYSFPSHVSCAMNPADCHQGHTVFPRRAVLAVTLPIRIRPVNPSFPLSTWSDTPLEMEPCASSTGARKRGCRMIKKQDVEKRRFWQRMIGEAARSGISIREFCRRHRLKESQFLLVAAQAQGRSTGTDIAQARNRPGSGELCAGQRRTGSNGRRPRARAGGRTSAAHPQGRG